MTMEQHPLAMRELQIWCNGDDVAVYGVRSRSRHRVSRLGLVNATEKQV